MKKYINIILLIIWMFFIFTMSSFEATQSNNQSEYIVNLLSNIFNINNLNTLSYIIRKTAHVTEYAILGFLTLNVIKTTNTKTYLGLIIAITYAISDEIHQLFVPGRSCQITDICIDTLGILIGFIIHKYIFKFIKKYNIHI